MQLGQIAVNIIDYVVIGISGFVFLVSFLGAFAVVILCRAPAHVEAKEFNAIWRARVFMQIFGGLYAGSQILRLQVLFGPSSILVDDGHMATLFCRAFTAVAWGLCEPLFLLLALFSCVFSLQGPKAFTAHLNTSIVIFAAVLSMPACAGQLVCSLFTTIFNMDYYGEWLLRVLFTTYDIRLTNYCNTELNQSMIRPPPMDGPHAPEGYPPGQANSTNSPPGIIHPSPPNEPDLPGPPPPSPATPLAPGAIVGYGDNCAFCTFALFSTLISAGLGVCIMLILLFVTHKVYVTTINRTLKRRMRFLQIFTVLFISCGLVCRGVTCIYQPFSLDFEVLRLVNVVCIAGTILTLSTILVFLPIWESYCADRMMTKLLRREGQQFTTNPLLMYSRGPTNSPTGSPHSRSPLVKNAVRPV